MRTHITLPATLAVLAGLVSWTTTAQAQEVVSMESFRPVVVNYVSPAAVPLSPMPRFYAPAPVPMTTYYAPNIYTPAPVTTFYPAPYTTYYAAPYVGPFYASPYVVRPRVYVRGEPVRNVFRAVVP